MKSQIVEDKGRIYISNIPRLEWCKGTDTSFIRSAQLALNAMGENFSYDQLMGISGAAFRFHFHPDWCPSSGDVTTGFDVSKILFESLGYAAELYSIDDRNFEDIRSLYRRILTQIDRGSPIVAINLKVCPEWGIITGYLQNKPGILCRTYFDESDDYSLADHAPWLSYFISYKGDSLHEDVLLINALRIAVQLGETDQFEAYKSGFSAFNLWISELRNYLTIPGANSFEHWEVNLTLFNCLVDSRNAALNYFSEMIEKGGMLNGEQIISNYKKEIRLLRDTQTNLLPAFESGPEKWTRKILEKQIRILEQVVVIEQELIRLFRDELKY